MSPERLIYTQEWYANGNPNSEKEFKITSIKAFENQSIDSIEKKSYVPPT
jgi:hypothetical protein